ncbi:MAG TPA: hypothetical protein VLS48_04515, partial [Anaerolineales bacterium]|nr:hypothetical protein [Anaerolineales bacterium]
LLDEPTRGLDYEAKEKLGTLIAEWRAQGAAVLLVTHDVELAAASADRVMILENGRVAAAGQPAQTLAQAPAFLPQIAQAFPGRGWLTPEQAARELQHRPTK